MLQNRLARLIARLLTNAVDTININKNSINMTLQQLKEAKRIESHITNCEGILNELNKNLDNNRYKFAVFSYDSSWSYFNTDEDLGWQ